MKNIKEKKSNKFMVSSFHSVKNIIGSPFFDIEKIFISEEKENNLIRNSALKKGLKVEIIPSSKFEKYCSEKKNQGVFAIVKEYNYISWEEMINIIPKRKNKLIVCLDGIEDPNNFGSIIRTSAAFLVDCIIISSKNQVPVNSTVIKVSTGGAAYVPVCKVDNLLDSLNKLKNQNYTLISTVCDNSLDYNELKVDYNCCVIFGSESNGIKNKILSISDKKISIPIFSKINSLNVSVSFGIVISKIL